jgi:hypothetical protein
VLEDDYICFHLITPCEDESYIIPSTGHLPVPGLLGVKYVSSATLVLIFPSSLLRTPVSLPIFPDISLHLQRWKPCTESTSLAPSFFEQQMPKHFLRWLKTHNSHRKALRGLLLYPSSLGQVGFATLLKPPR